jgi:hypothetical protein
VFYDIETTQDKKFSENATEHIKILVCAQQFCTACEMQDYIEMDLSAVVGEAIHSTTIQWAIYYLIYVNLDPGVIKSWS